MADRCKYCSVRMDGLEVHSDSCPVRGPEIVDENEVLKSENEILVQKVEALELQKEDVLKILEKVASAARPGGYIGQDGQLLKEVERVLAGAHEEPK